MVMDPILGRGVQLAGQVVGERSFEFLKVTDVHVRMTLAMAELQVGVQVAQDIDWVHRWVDPAAQWLVAAVRNVANHEVERAVGTAPGRAYQIIQEGQVG